ncbi:MAG TPA: septum site-determining protein MinD [Thermotogota bacterium]|nr:septum site-determining protein MinD [Thermotogota bacterium]HRW33890.1 septum site-determining protein MinD [Thermotogota bacterium]
MKNRQVIVVTSGKGGVGKTTVTANLGAAFANLGKKVCLIDGDLGLKNLDVVLGLENRILYTVMDVVSGRVGAQEALVRHKTNRNLFLLPASQIATKEMMTVEDMTNVVTRIKADFDYIIIDSPAGIESGFRNAVAAADTALLVTNPEYTAVSDADRVLGLLENTHLGLDNVFFILNKVKEGMNEKRGMLKTDEVMKTLSIPMIGMVPDSDEIFIGSNRGIPIAFEPSHDMNKIFTNITRRIMGHNIPIEQDFKLAKTSIWKLLIKLFRS